VTEAFGGAPGAAAASSYALVEPGRLAPVSGSVGDTRSEVCWAVVTHDGRFAFVTNFGDGTISSYAMDTDAQRVFGWSVTDNSSRSAPSKGLRPPSPDSPPADGRDQPPRAARSAGYSATKRSRASW